MPDDFASSFPNFLKQSSSSTFPNPVTNLLNTPPLPSTINMQTSLSPLLNYQNYDPNFQNSFQNCSFGSNPSSLPSSNEISPKSNNYSLNGANLTTQNVTGSGTVPTDFTQNYLSHHGFGQTSLTQHGFIQNGLAQNGLAQNGLAQHVPAQHGLTSLNQGSFSQSTLPPKNLPPNFDFGQYLPPQQIYPPLAQQQVSYSQQPKTEPPQNQQDFNQNANFNSHKPNQ